MYTCFAKDQEAHSPFTTPPDPPVTVPGRPRRSTQVLEEERGQVVHDRARATAIAPPILAECAEVLALPEMNSGTSWVFYSAVYK